MTKELEKGSVVIGYYLDKDVKKEVSFDLSKRLKNTLILGPTGCGRVDFSILPMINQDMQNKDLGIVLFDLNYLLSDNVYAMAKHYNREVVYFNPLLKNCPSFNPLSGDEIEVKETLVKAFKSLTSDLPSYFKDLNGMFISGAVRIVKELYKEEATLKHLFELFYNVDNAGCLILDDFSKIKCEDAELAHKNKLIVELFSDYFSGMKSEMGASKNYEYTYAIRDKLSALLEDETMRAILIPNQTEREVLDIKSCIEEGKVLIVSTNPLDKFLNILLTNKLIQSSINRKIEDDSKYNMIYFREYPAFLNCNKDLIKLLILTRSKRIGINLSIQSHGQLELVNKELAEITLDSTCNKIIYPGISLSDSENYSFYLNEKATDIIYKPFGQISYLTYGDDYNFVDKECGTLMAEPLPKELKNDLDKIIENARHEELKKN